jgi:hypothetical protein
VESPDLEVRQSQGRRLALRNGETIARRQQMQDRSHLRAITGICAVAATRIFFRSRFLYDVDSVNFALALQRFDPAVHQPHPPGYFLYICLGRLLNGLIPDANAALVTLSIGASCGAAWMLYLLTREWFHREAALLSILLFLVSPLCWFHGIVALTYIVEAFFSACIGYLCWRVYTGSSRLAVPASIVLGIAAGFRPSTALFLGPLWLFSIWRVPGRRRWLAILAAGAAILAWFVPMTEAAGGIRQYFAAFEHLWSAVPGRRTTLASPWLAVARIATIGWIFVLCFGSASLLLFRKNPGGCAKPDHRRFCALWIIPGLLFFAFVFLNYVNSGYLLILSPPVFAILASRLHAFLAAPDRRLRWIVIAAGVSANCAVFGFAPLYCTYASVHKFERNLGAITDELRSGVAPARTLIVGFDSHFLGYRHAGYYLPGFTTAQYPEVPFGNRTKVFLMRDGDTRVVDQLAARDFDRFILFPLPDGAGYAGHLEGVLQKLPPGTMSQVTVGDREFLAGPASALRFLFPATFK